MDKETLSAIQVNIKEAEKKLSEMQKDIIDAKKAGIDVTTQESTFKDLAQKVAQIKSVYLK